MNFQVDVLDPITESVRTLASGRKVVGLNPNRIRSMSYRYLPQPSLALGITSNSRVGEILACSLSGQCG